MTTPTLTRPAAPPDGRPGTPATRRPSTSAHGPAGVHRLLPIDGEGRSLDLSLLADHAAHHGPLPVIAGPARGLPGPLAAQLDAAGLRGRGGGWFPVARKMSAVVASAGRRRSRAGRSPVVLANGMEGEPYSHKDALLLTLAPHLVLDGLQAAARTVGARSAFLLVHEGSPVLPTVQAAAAQRQVAGIDPVTVHVMTAPARYVASEESALAHWVGDGRALPTSGARPVERGVRGRPTLVQNVETLAHIALVARHGADWFRRVGSPAAPGTTLVSVGGAVVRPGVVEVPVGTPARTIVARCGGPVGAPQAALTGGFGGAWVSWSTLAGTPWEPEAVREAGGAVGASVLWLLPPGADGLTEASSIAAYLADQSAGQCGPCRLGLPAVAADLDLLARGRATETDTARLRERLDLVTGRGGCRLPDGAARMVASALEVFS